MPLLNKRKTDRLFCNNSYRIIDANINRAKEAFRVCEDICRFNLDNAEFASILNKMRHNLTTTIKKANLNQHRLFENRDSELDVGKKFSFGLKRTSFKEIFLANSQRSKEALRVIEEFLKIFDNSASKKIQKLRFDTYAIEKKIIKKFPSLLSIG